MKEVSCKVLDVFFRDLRKRRRPAEAFVRGVPYDLAHLTNRHERVDWDAFLTLMRNAGELWTDDELIALGGGFVSSPLMLPVTIVARLLFTPMDFYRWVNSPGSGGGNLLFTCVVPDTTELGPNRLRLTLRMREGYAPAREFFLVTQGGLAAMSRFLGYREAHVKLFLEPGGAHYDIEVPAGRAPLGLLRRAVSWPFTARRTARELKEAHAVTLERYMELEQARDQLERQARQLEMTEAISRLVHAGLDLGTTLDAIATSVCVVAGFGAARVTLSELRPGDETPVEAAHGEPEPDAVEVELALVLRGVPRGHLRVWLARDQRAHEARQLLESASHTIALAVDNALAYSALDAYRDELEDRVSTRTLELEAAHDDLAQTVEDLREAQSARDRIFANINHEIRTPLSLITLTMAHLRSLGLADNPAVTRAHEAIDQSVQRLLYLIDGLLLLAAGQEGKLEVRPVPCDVGHLVRRAVTSWAPAAEDARVGIHYRGPEHCTGVVDWSALDRVVANLVSNAVKFTPPDGRIEVTLTCDEAVLRVLVADTGVGIPEPHRERIFERFEQVRSVDGRAKRGSGVGLAIARELVVAHGGALTVRDNPGGGSIFEVTLPRHAAVSGDALAETVAAGVDELLARPEHILGSGFTVPEVVSIAPEGAPTVLIAEDDRDLLMTLSDLLSRHYRVLAGADGAAALRLAREHLPDLLVTDIDMPEMDGLALMRQFRELRGNRLAPVILLTAYGARDERVQGLEQGAVDYIVKPFDPDELMARIRAQLAIRDLALKLHESEKLASVGLLSAGLAHEIRNPANTVVNALPPLKELMPPEVFAPGSDTAELFEVLEASAQQIAKLSQVLLGFARPGDINRTVEPLAPIIDRAVAIIGAVLARVTFWREDTPGLRVACAPALLLQVLTNLLENAAHAAGQDGWVSLRAYVRDGRVRLEVSDSGPGVPAELRERIFEPFFTTKAPGQGTGLGLTTARRIVEQHHGSLRVLEGPTGTVFVIELPGVGEQAVPESPPAPAAARSRSTS